MKKLKSKAIISILSLLLILSYTMPTYASTYSFEQNKKELNEVLEEVYKERSLGTVSKEKIDKLEEILNRFNVSPEEINATGEMQTFGFNQWTDLGKGWKMTVHRPHGSNATKYHTHVKKGGVEAKEALDGTSTHGKGNTMNNKGVPKDIQNKVRNHKDVKKARDEEAKAKQAKRKMNSQGLKLKIRDDLIIAISIFVSIVGVTLFALTEYASWLAVLLIL
ncbi:TPA: hypothetical protein SOK56_003616 [Clostridioides difficile]|nr:hypothetical protein [Clostridioides difficile]HEK4613517.1 hypothetical protein [Clostridioides difficile]HEK4840760.1 hypothetical protein [Clostridioides difficile]HEK4881714.1 hypothetical protein [Clostridioides difficile]